MISLWSFAAIAQPSGGATFGGKPDASGEHRLALVIGNGAYKTTPLNNPVNDAKAMAATLETLGFEVMMMTDASLRQMQQAIIAFGQKIQNGGVGVFYYAGHGLQVKGRNYLVPIDANITSEPAVRVEAIEVDLVTEQMGDAHNRVNIIILDACRDNPFQEKLRGGSRGLAPIDASSGTLIAYATAPGSVAEDGRGANGLYTEELLKALHEPGLEAEEVFKHVRAAVVQRSRGAQTPWESSSLTGDLIFNPTVTVPPPAAAASAGFDQRQLELAFWETIKSSTDANDFRDYLARYPQGEFRSLAERRLLALRSAAPAAPAPAQPKQPVAIAPPRTTEPPRQPPYSMPAKRSGTPSHTPPTTASPADKDAMRNNACVQAVSRYNARVSEYNARCSGRPFSSALVAETQAHLSCPVPAALIPNNAETFAHFTDRQRSADINACLCLQQAVALENRVMVSECQNGTR
jgi:uncharacterized caspase-like protein